MIHKVILEEPERVDAMTTLEAVAYANRLSNRLKYDGCTEKERQKLLRLLGRLTERVQFLKITLEPPRFCRVRWRNYAESGGAS